MNVAAEAFHCCFEDFVMVEGQLWEIVDREPDCFIGIVSANDFGRLYQRIVGNGDDALTRITVGIRKNTQFTDGSGLQAGLFT